MRLGLAKLDKNDADDFPEGKSYLSKTCYLILTFWNKCWAIIIAF